MNWRLAIDLARSCEDVTYEEWCNLYYERPEPPKAQVEKAIRAAHPILVRNNVIEESVRFYHEKQLIEL